MLHLQGRDRRRQRADRRRRLLPAGPRDHLRRDRRPLRPGRAGRPGHGRRPSSSAAVSWQQVGGAPYLHTLLGQRPDRRQRAATTPTIVREKAILRRLVDAGTKIAQMGYAGEGDVDATVDGPSRRSTRSARSAPQEDYAPLSAIMEATLDEIEAISNHDGTTARRADRLRRPRRAGQRLLRRPDDHRRRAARGRQVDAGPGLLPVRVDPQQPDQRDLQPGDVQERDHHAAALGGGEDPAEPHPQGRR